MIVIPFKDIGIECATKWGPSIEQSVDEFIKSASPERLHTCLLSALVQQLVEISKKIDRIDDVQIAMLTQASRNQKTDGHPSDGMLTAINRSIAKTDFSFACPVDSELKGKLSTRARRAICKLRHKHDDSLWMDQITEDALSEIQNCGMATIAEIMKWKESLDR